MDKIKILVACHKPCECKENNVYTPIHVGRAISSLTAMMGNVIGDDSGENISNKNPYYSELTAQYWGWKNLDVEYIGLAHYRRYFEMQIDENNVDDVFEKYDIILSRKNVEKYSMADKISLDANIEDLYIFVHCIKKISPDYYDAIVKALSGNVLTPFNMFVMRKKDFDVFATWQFAVLSEMESMIKLSGYSRPNRVLGYVSEIMLYVFAKKNNLRIKYEKVVDLEQNEVMKEKYNFWRVLFVNVGFNGFCRRQLQFNNQAVLSGLKNDGITINL